MERGAHTTASLFCYNLARCVKIRSSNSYREEEEIQVDGLKLDLMKMAGIQSLPAVAAVSEKKDTPRGTGLSFEDLLERPNYDIAPCGTDFQAAWPLLDRGEGTGQLLRRCCPPVPAGTLPTKL